MTKEPSDVGGLRLPVDRGKPDYDCWWPNYGKHGVEGSVPNHGRGALGKVALLPYSTYVGYRKALQRYSNGYGSIDMVEELFLHKEWELHSQHPFADDIALAPIAAMVQAWIVSDAKGDSECDDEFVEETLLPWIEWAWENTFQTDYENVTDDEALYAILRKATEQLKKRPDRCNTIELLPFATQMDVEDCIETFHAERLISDISLDEVGKYYPIKRLRLNGNYKRGEILRAAIVGKSATLVDLEYCTNLDDECLDLILHHLIQVKVLLLKGTPIRKTSYAIRNSNTVRKKVRTSYLWNDDSIPKYIDFVFEDVCKCCGKRSRVKELKAWVSAVEERNARA